MDWIKNFIIPTIEVVFIGGFISGGLYFVCKAFWNAWRKQGKFFFKYKIKRKIYPENTVKWVIDCMDKGIGYYDAKKFLFVKGMSENQIYETLFIYDQILKELKGGINNNVRVKGNDRKDQGTEELPSIQ